MYRTSTAPPGRWSPRIVRISLSQARDSARPTVVAAGRRHRSREGRSRSRSLALRPTSRHRRPPRECPSTIPAPCPARPAGFRRRRAKQQGFGPAEQGLDPSCDGQSDRDADHVRDGVADPPIAADRGEHLDDLGDGRHGHAPQRDPGVSRPRGPGPEPEDREDDEDPPVDDLVQVGDLEPGRSSPTSWTHFPGIQHRKKITKVQSAAMATRTLSTSTRPPRAERAPRPRRSPASSRGNPPVPASRSRNERSKAFMVTAPRPAGEAGANLPASSTTRFRQSTPVVPVLSATFLILIGSSHIERVRS